jgi:hypothetical protein
MVLFYSNLTTLSITAYYTYGSASGFHSPLLRVIGSPSPSWGADITNFRIGHCYIIQNPWKNPCSIFNPFPQRTDETLEKDDLHPSPAIAANERCCAPRSMQPVCSPPVRSSTHPIPRSCSHAPDRPLLRQSTLASGVGRWPWLPAPIPPMGH